MFVQLVEKLADGNARLREGARKALEISAGSSLIGPGVVCFQLTKPLPAKQKTAWRPIAARLELLTYLVQTYGLGGSGLQLESILSFPKTAQAYSHSNGEVRDAAKYLVVALQKLVGTAPLEPTLALLRKNQRAEYLAAFNEPEQDGNSSGQKARQIESNVDSSSKRTDMSHQHATQMPGGKVPTSANKVQGQANGYDAKPNNAMMDRRDEQEVGGQQEFTTCMFCGVHNSKWNENDLDVHYWKDCPLLISCPSCAQIVEIAGLPEHLLDECDAKASYVPCEVTGK